MTPTRSLVAGLESLQICEPVLSITGGASGWVLNQAVEGRAIALQGKLGELPRASETTHCFRPDLYAHDAESPP